MGDLPSRAACVVTYCGGDWLYGHIIEVVMVVVMVVVRGEGVIFIGVNQPLISRSAAGALKKGPRDTHKRLGIQGSSCGVGVCVWGGGGGGGTLSKRIKRDG